MLVSQLVNTMFVYLSFVDSLLEPDIRGSSKMFGLATLTVVL